MTGSEGTFSAAIKYVIITLLLSAVAIAIGICSLLLEKRYDAVPAEGEINGISGGNAWSADSVLVVIDAGHGGIDGGCIGIDGTLEKDLNLAVAEKICEMLLARGIRCVMTRCDDELLYDMYGDLDDYTGQKKLYDLKNRVRYASEFENAVFVSIHMNTFSRPQYSGLQVWYSGNNEGSKRLADIIALTVKSSLQPENDRSVKRADSSMYVLDRIALPAVLIECGFLSNAEECEKLCDDEYQRALALAISSAIAEYLAEGSVQGGG
ncbi:MAG: N-acetylmuramoyl-L-alanine amidase [Clostridiales bacterium]|nr:N-acetylmuramoyl-L-alanine amidase [Clostridiales bacterium]